MKHEGKRHRSAAKGGYYDGYGDESYRWTEAERKRALGPLIEHLSRYDAHRERLERTGGKVDDLRSLTALLGQKVELRGPYGTESASLTDTGAMGRVVREVGGLGVHLQVRVRASGLPVYYLCRTRGDYWGNYRLVVEDHYLSPDYPMVDGRFVRLQDYGRDVYHLRLSPLQPAARKLAGKSEVRTAASLDYAYDGPDRLLYAAGRHVLQAAWHEDQRLAALVAEHFGAPEFLRAIELIYLCAGGDLVGLRNELVADDSLPAFFSDVYPQPALAGLLASLAAVDGRELSELPRVGLGAYPPLARAFGRFLNSSVRFGQRGVEQPLYKPVFANVERLGMVAEELRENEAIHAAVEELQNAGRQAAEGILTQVEAMGRDQRRAS